MGRSLQQGFPNISAPLTNPMGIIQQAWLQLLIQLWNRTGGAQGGTTFQSGDVKLSAALDLEDGWLLCDGAAYSRKDYPELFAVIQTTWGSGDGSTTFNVPDFRDRFPRGLSNSDPVGSTGGADSVTLTIANLATHTHVIDDPTHTHTVIDPGHAHTITDPGHAHDYDTYAADAVAGSGANTVADNSVGATTTSAVTGITINSHTTGITNANAATGVTAENTGSSTPFNIIPKFASVAYLIKT